MEDRIITAALKLDASQVQLPADLLDRICREGAPVVPVRPGFWTRLRLGSAVEVLAACILIAGFLGLVAWHSLRSGTTQPAGESGDQSANASTIQPTGDNIGQSLSDLREQVPFLIFVPTNVPLGLVMDLPEYPNPTSPAITIAYQDKDGNVELRVTNGPAGCCLDADSRKEVGAASIRGGITAFFVVNQPKFGGPILWWQERGTYVALSGPNMTREQLVKIAESMLDASTREDSRAADQEAASGKEPDVRVDVDLNAATELQAQVDLGHTPGRMDPWQVTLDFLVFESRSWQRGWKAEVIENTGTTAIVSIDQGDIERVYLERLVRKDKLGVWSVVGYDLRDQ